MTRGRGNPSGDHPCREKRAGGFDELERDLDHPRLVAVDRGRGRPDRNFHDTDRRVDQQPRTLRLHCVIEQKLSDWRLVADQEAHKWLDLQRFGLYLPASRHPHRGIRDGLDGTSAFGDYMGPACHTVQQCHRRSNQLLDTKRSRSFCMRISVTSASVLRSKANKFLTRLYASVRKAI
jgi:hypothetical protein